MRRTILGLIVSGSHYPLLMATNVRALPKTPFPLPLIQDLNTPIIGFKGLFPGLFVILSLPNGPYGCQQCFGGFRVLK
jgi:hypothetical protein